MFDEVIIGVDEHQGRDAIALATQLVSVDGKADGGSRAVVA
jgi:hypothetical protein